jgi:hypothetical protein
MALKFKLYTSKCNRNNLTAYFCWAKPPKVFTFNQTSVSAFCFNKRIIQKKITHKHLYLYRFRLITTATFEFTIEKQDYDHRRIYLHCQWTFSSKKDIHYLN